jgi:type I restriction enzyme R subunit
MSLYLFTNGHLYTEYAEDTGHIHDTLSLATFPTPQELKERYEAIKGLHLDSENTKPLLMQYKGGEAARYYFQDAAIRAALEKIARGEKKILLSLATGTGKTIIATQLLYKLAQAGKVKRALFVCDRDELRTQGNAKMHAIFGDNAQIVTTQDPQRNAKILVATYQTLNVTEEDEQILE